MSRLMFFGIILSVFAFMSCDSLLGKDNEDDSKKPGPPKEEETGIDYTNYLSNYSIKLKNDANRKLVAFKGSPSASSYISGVPISGGEHGLKKDAALFGTSGDFVLFLVTEEDYLDNKDNLTALASKPFTRIYAYFNTNAENKLTYTISSILGGDKKIILQNNTNYNVELRKDGVQGELIGYAGKGTLNTTFFVEPGDYSIFPVFRKFNESRGEIISVYPRYQSGDGIGKAKFQEYSLTGSDNEITINASAYTVDIELKTGSAYLTIHNNNPNTAMRFYDGQKNVTTSTGGQMINPNNFLTFQIDMPTRGNSKDEYLDSVSKGAFRIGSSDSLKTVPEFTFYSDKVYSITVSGSTPYDINLSDIKDEGEMTF
jgi:hypothetical protein